MIARTMTSPPVSTPGSGITYRRWRGLEEVPGMAAANQRVRSHCGILEPVDVEGMRHRYTHLVNSDPLRDCIVVERGGQTVGYGRAEWQDLTDGDRVFDSTIVVAPDQWGDGISGALLDWCEARLLAIAPNVPGERRAWFATVGFDGDDELERTARDRGYVAVRWGAEMLRPTMEDLPQVPPLPDGYEIRPMPPDRLLDVGWMVIGAFREHWGESEQGEERIDDWTEHPRFDPALVSVVWHGDAPVACVAVRLDALPDGRPGAMVGPVATHPAHRRRGLARAALADALQRVDTRGISRAYLGVDTDNHNRAFALYEEAGFRKASGSTNYRRPFDRRGQET